MLTMIIISQLQGVFPVWDVGTVLILSTILLWDPTPATQIQKEMRAAEFMEQMVAAGGGGDKACTLLSSSAGV